MPLSPFERRMSKLEAHLPPPPWDPGADKFKEFCAQQVEGNIQLRLRREELTKRIPHWVFSRMKGGSGLTMSRTLREFFQDYNLRIFKLGPYALPSSFNVVESFMSFCQDSGLFDLRPEIEHLLSGDDYFDWYSTDTMPKAPDILIDIMRDGIIYSYDMTSNSSGYRLSTENSTLVIAGVSFIRHGSELSCVLVAGESPPDPSDAEAIECIKSPAMIPIGKEGVVPCPDLGISDRYLDAFPGFARVLLLTRFDLRAKKHGVRYLYRDTGAGYDVLTDDTRIYGELSEAETENQKKKFLAKLTQYGGLFSALASLIYLPISFTVEADSIHEEEFATELSSRKDEECVRDAIKYLGENECVFSRRIRCMPVFATEGLDREKTLTPPKLAFQASGFWKPIPPSEIGRDKDNKPIMGKTWVECTESWSAQSPSTFLIQRVGELPPQGPDPGTVYVMRSPSHAPGIYKVGLTRRTAEARAKDLSKTPTPLPFGVLAEWKVGDCAAVEKEAHARLKTRRIDRRREFFLAELSEITAIIEGVVNGSL